MQAAKIAQEIAEALAAAHAQGVIHRDIKPANVMITRDGKVLVMDFGIARLISGPETAPQTSAVLGTASYLSPEQAQGQSVDARTDIYSLGVVLYEMLTGRPPFTGDSPMAIAYKQVNATPRAAFVGQPRGAARAGRCRDAGTVEEPRQPLPDRTGVRRRPGASADRRPGLGDTASAGQR